MAQLNDNPIRVGLLGAGTVGSQTARLLVEQKDELAARIGRPIELVGVACLNPDEVDFPWIDKSLLTTDTMKVATNADIVVELIGGTTVARTFVMAAIESGASVVTANKALLAKYGPEIYTAAEAKGVDIYFEAAVGGAIPFLLPLRESLAGDKVTSMLGIVNGTTNYILDEMTTKGLQFDDVLKDAQAKGYAEADPTGDIEGYDAANKAAIMATLGFHTNVTIDDVSVEGITKITADDIAAAAAEHKVIKLLAVVENGRRSDRFRRRRRRGHRSPPHRSRLHRPVHPHVPRAAQGADQRQPRRVRRAVPHPRQAGRARRHRQGVRRPRRVDQRRQSGSQADDDRSWL